VTDGATSPATDPAHAGWVELTEGRWEAARALFEEALSASETAAAWEGLSWAAWWLDDASAVFDARERAFRLYGRDGDPASAARIAAWLAADELDFHGAAAVASGWLARAHTLVDDLEPGPAHGWLAFFEGYVASMRGDSEVAGELGARAAALGRRLRVADLEMLGLALEGSALVARGRIDEGMRRLDEATVGAVAGEAALPISGAWACCFLVSSCLAVRDFERAAEWCDRIASFADRYGSRYLLAFCRSEYGAVHLWRGDWDLAGSLLEASVEDYSRSRPAFVPSAQVQLAELQRRRGLPAESERLLDGLSSPAATLVRARLALDADDPAAASELAERHLRGYEDGSLRRAPALEVVVRAKLALGELEAAQGAADELDRLARAGGAGALDAAAKLARGMVAAARRDHQPARLLLEDAVDALAGAGAPFDVALARMELARMLLAAGRREGAEREARLAVDGLARLGAAGELRRARRLLAACTGAPERSQTVTPRERDVLRLLVEGLTNRQIAERLVVSEHTVHRHVANLLRKLGVRSRAAAAAHAVREGLLESAERRQA
jgi:DNA-binding NarL/FixJ family response regulator